MRCSPLAVKRYNQRQAHRDFRRRHRDDEEDKDLSIEIVVES